MGTLNLEYDRGVDGLEKLKKLQAAIDKATEAGDDKAIAELTSHRDTIASGMSSAKWDEGELSQNKKVVKDYKRWYESAKGEEYTGSDEDAVVDFKRLMRGYNYALTSWVGGEESTAGLALEADNWSPKALQAFSDMSDLYDNTDLGALSTAKNWASATAGDPTFVGSTLASIFTFGVATPATFGTRTAAVEAGKLSIRQLIKNRLKALAPKTAVGKTAAITAAEGGALTGADDLARQEVENPDAEYDWGRGARNTALGVGGGGLLGGGGAKLSQWNKLRKGKGSLSDHLDKGITDNNAVKGAHKIVGNPIRQAENWTAKQTGRLLNAAKDKLNVGIAKLPKGAQDVVSDAGSKVKAAFGTDQSRASKGAGGFAKDAFGYALNKAKAKTKLPGAATAPFRSKEYKNKMLRGLVRVGGGYADGGISAGAKAFPRVMRGIVSPANQAKAEKLAWGKGAADELPAIKTEAQIQQEAQQAYAKQQAEGGSVYKDAPIFPTGAVTADVAPVQKTVARPPIKGQKVAGSTSQAKEAQALKAKEAAAKKDISKGLTTIQKKNLKEGDVAIRDPKTGKFILCKKGGK